MNPLPAIHLTDMRKARITFVERSDLAALSQLARNYVYFHLQGTPHDAEQDSRISQHLGITSVELAKCLPWIPGSSSIFLHSFEGFTPVLLAELKALPTDRELLLVNDSERSAASLNSQRDRTAPMTP